MVTGRIHGDDLVSVEHTGVAVYRRAPVTHQAVIENAINVHVIADDGLRVNIIGGLLPE